MTRNFGQNTNKKFYHMLGIIVLLITFVAIMSSFSSAWFMDESSTSNGDPNITYVGDLDMEVTTNFKFKNLALAPDTIYLSDQDGLDIATYIKTSTSHNIDGAYVRIKFETTRKNVGSSTFTDNSDLLGLYFLNNLTTSTTYSSSNEPMWYYNASDQYYYYLGGVYDANVMFNRGYRTSNTMTNSVANADVTIKFTVDCIQRQYGAAEALWTTSPQVFKDMVSVESVKSSTDTKIYVNGVLLDKQLEFGIPISQALSKSGMSSLYTDSNTCGWYSDEACTQPLDLSQEVTANLKMFTKMATLDKLTITQKNGQNVVTKVSKSVTAGDIVIPNNVQVIDKNAFEDCTIGNLIIPSSVTEIKQLAFNITSIGVLYIPATVTKLDEYLCVGLYISQIKVDSANPNYTDGGGTIV